MKKIIYVLSLSNSLLYAQYNPSYTDIVINTTNKYREYIHNSLVKTSSYLDNYYFENKYEDLDKYNNTYALIELSVYKNHSNNIKFDQKVKIKLELPKLQDKIQLVLESEEKRDSQDFVENHTTNKNDKYNLSLLYNKKLKNIISLKAKLGLKINKKLDPFVKIEAKKTWNKDKYKFVISQALKQSVNKKLESTTFVELTTKINQKKSISLYNEYYWNSPKKNVSSFYNSISLNQKLSNKNYLTYKVDLNTDNEKSNLKTKRFSFQVKYRHLIKKWLYIDFIPENFYKREENFKSQYGLRFNIGIYFSKHK